MRLNLAGYKWLDYDGYGRYCIKTARSLIRAGHDVYPLEVDALKDKPAWFLRAQGLDFSVVTLQLMPPHMMAHVPGRSVAYSMHESMKLPDGWADHVNHKAQWLLVPSPWLVEVFEDAGVKVPIRVVKSGIDPDECQITQTNNHRPFTIGCLCDRGTRKGWDIAYTAFYKAFDFHNRDVRLLMKCRPGGRPPGMDFSYSSDPRLSVWDTDVSQIADIYAQMDVFAFPTRCEGWGQPPREAAACGVLPIVTRWSGTDDDTECWAYPLNKFEMIESHMKGSGGLWAEPDVDELVEAFRWAYNHQDEYKARGLQAAQWLRQHRTYAQAADKLVHTMAELMGGIL